MSDIKTKTERDSKSDSTEPKTSFFDLTPSQIESLAQTAASEAIAETWAMGLPITTEVDGKMCKKYSDGRIEWM
ncbi:MAG: hypothetical protein QNJ72_44480 [Pleurocapsa sp. MO_226.B13]|nr:hypothetical protein [Pleurocapsa sp. MO_226.B13]